MSLTPGVSSKFAILLAIIVVIACRLGVGAKQSTGGIAIQRMLSARNHPPGGGGQQRGYGDRGEWRQKIAAGLCHAPHPPHR
jgi:hypothetical protein